MLKPYNKAEVTFEIIREIGQNGQNSRTFVSHDHQLDAEIVTKQIRKAKLASPANFFDESKALYASAHPNVVQIHYACEDAQHIYLAMPYYQRGSVKEMIAGQFMTVREIVKIGCNVLTGLHNIHSKNLIHFDLKPDNILISDRGEALVSDFGQAKQMNFAGIAAQDRLYTPMIPPEGTQVDHFDLTFDIYQFGLLLYRMCNGDEVFHGQFARYRNGPDIDRAALRHDLLNGNFPDRSAFHPHIPSKMRKIIKQCLEVASADRYQSAIECANALAAIDGNTLDWRLSIAGGIRTWEKNKMGTTGEVFLTFAVKPNGEATCLKSVNGGQARRFSEGCAARMTERQIMTFLGDN